MGGTMHRGRRHRRPFPLDQYRLLGDRYLASSFWRVDPHIKQRLAELGAIYIAGDAGQFDVMFAVETECWRKVVGFPDRRKSKSGGSFGMAFANRSRYPA